MKIKKQSNIFVKAAAFTFVAFISVTIIKLQFDYNKLKEQKNGLEILIETQEEYNESLKERLESPYNRDYIIRVAREKLGYCLPDEIIIYNDR